MRAVSNFRDLPVIYHMHCFAPLFLLHFLVAEDEVAVENCHLFRLNCMIFFHARIRKGDILKNVLVIFPVLSQIMEAAAFKCQ